jgi:PAS domain S-box-containing protein
VTLNDSLASRQRFVEKAVYLPKILAVDDKAENLHSLKRLLEGLPAEVVAVQSGPEALAQLLRHEFALVLLDVMMPDMDGFETANLIRGQEGSWKIPIIFVTAADRSDAFEGRGYELGAVDYLFKPLQPQVLLCKVRAFLEQAVQRQQLARHLSEIRQLRDHNALLLRAVGDGILGLDREGRINFANPAASRLSGYEVAALSGRSLDGLLLRPGQQSVHLEWLSQQPCRHSEREIRYEEYWVRHSDGRLLPVDCTLSPLYEGNDGLSGWVLALQDISERKAREALEISSKYKSAFLSNISHELRTPLHSLLILARRLVANEEGNLNIDQIRAANVIQREGRDLLRLINDVLDLAKVEAGKLTIDREDVSLSELREHLRVQFEPMATERGLGFDWMQGDRLPATLYTDRRRLQQILKNLLANAFKFTYEGNVRIDVKVVSLEGVEAVAFSVTDTGIGIADDMQQAIFDAFQQVDDAINRHYEGTGLGLAICRELTQLLCGRLELQSRPGHGSVFTLYLPLKPGAELLLTGSSESRARGRSEPVVEAAGVLVSSEILSSDLAAQAAGKTLLLVDSDMRTTFTLSALLRRHGFRVLKADSHSAALARIEMESSIDGVIQALMSPQVEAERLLETATDKSDFVIGLVDPAMPNMSEQCYRFGIHDYLEKPVDCQRLLDSLLSRLKAGSVVPDVAKEITP